VCVEGSPPRRRRWPLTVVARHPIVRCLDSTQTDVHGSPFRIIGVQLWKMFPPKRRVVLGPKAAIEIPLPRCARRVGVPAGRGQWRWCSSMARIIVCWLRIFSYFPENGVDANGRAVTTTRRHRRGYRGRALWTAADSAEAATCACTPGMCSGRESPGIDRPYRARRNVESACRSSV
jgi:hypothetical protein